MSSAKIKKDLEQFQAAVKRLGDGGGKAAPRDGGPAGGEPAESPGGREAHPGSGPEGERKHHLRAEKNEEECTEAKEGLKRLKDNYSITWTYIKNIPANPGSEEAGHYDQLKKSYRELRKWLVNHYEYNTLQKAFYYIQWSLD